MEWIQNGWIDHWLSDECLFYAEWYHHWSIWHVNWGQFAGLAVSVLIQWPESRISERLHLFHCCSISALLWFPCLVPSRLQRCSLPKEYRTSPSATDNLFHKVFYPMTNVEVTMFFAFALTKSFSWHPDLIHCCNVVCQADLADHLKLLED